MKKLLVVIILVVSAGAAMAQSKIAHVNSQALLDTLPSRKIAIKKLQQFEADGIKELQTMQLDYQTALEKYRADVAAGTLTPVMRQIAEEKLIKKEEALQERDQSLQTEMQAYSNELNAPILKMLQDAVKVVSDRKKLDYVIDVSVALIANGEDLTKEVIVELLKMDAAAMKQWTLMIILKERIGCKIDPFLFGVITLGSTTLTVRFASQGKIYLRVSVVEPQEV